MTRLYLVPVSWQEARAFTRSWHRHHPRPPAGHKFSTGVAADGVLVGVAIVGRPTPRGFDDHHLGLEATTLEVTRTVTDGHRNANSLLYGAAARAAFALGFTRLLTYTEAGESGASLRAAGWHVVAERPARGGWDTPSRPRQNHGTDGIARTLWEATPYRPTTHPEPPAGSVDNPPSSPPNTPVGPSGSQVGPEPPGG